MFNKRKTVPYSINVKSFYRRIDTIQGHNILPWGTSIRLSMLGGVGQLKGVLTLNPTFLFISSCLAYLPNRTVSEPQPTLTHAHTHAPYFTESTFYTKGRFQFSEMGQVVINVLGMTKPREMQHFAHSYRKQRS